MCELGSSGSTPRTNVTPVRAAEVAGEQWGAIAAWQLHQSGVSASAIKRWRAGGWLHPVFDGVYAFGHRSLPYEGRLTAAILSVGRDAALSHGTAAWWWGLIPEAPEPIEVSVPRRARSRPGIRVHRARELEWTRHRRFKVTTVARTLVDCSARHSVSDVRQVLAEAEYKGLLDLQAIHAVMGRGRTGSATLRLALARHEPRIARAKSEVERRFLRLCEQTGLPMPEVNVKIGRMTVDALWREQRVVVEVDTYRTHGSRARMERDRRRELYLRARGFIVLRYTDTQIDEEPDAVAADLRLSLAARSA